MSQPFGLASNRIDLRVRAATHLSAGTVADTGRAGPADALAVLYQLASSPKTAGDALALLHELQVHQVELDLQQEELRNVRSELEAALSRQTALVERAPAAYMSVDTGTTLCEVNLAGARLLGAPRDQLLGRPLAGMLSPPGADVLWTLLARARDGLAPQTRELRLLPLAGVARAVYATADKDSVPERFLLVLMDVAPPDERVVSRG